MSFDAPSRPSEGRQSVPQTWDKLWDEAGGNWMDTEDVWNLSKMVGTSERRASTGWCREVAIQDHLDSWCTFSRTLAVQHHDSGNILFVALAVK